MSRRSQVRPATSSLRQATEIQVQPVVPNGTGAVEWLPPARPVQPQQPLTQMIYTKNGQPVNIQLSIPVNADRALLTDIRVKCQETEIWQDRINAQGCCIAGNEHWCAVGCTDGTIYLFSKTGRRLAPPLALPSRIALLKANNFKHLMCMACDLTVRVWDVVGLQSLISTKFDPILSAGASDLKIDTADLSPAGQPIIRLSTMEGFAWSSSLACWMRVVDNQFPQADHLIQSVPTASSLSLLNQLQRTTNYALPSSHAVANQSQLFQEMETLAFLETQVASSLILKSSAEFDYWFDLYVRELCNPKLLGPSKTARLKELGGFLLGTPPDLEATDPGTASLSYWDTSFSPAERRELLRNMLPIMANNRHLLRTVRRFADALEFYDQQQPTPASDLEFSDGAPLQASPLVVEPDDFLPPPPVFEGALQSRAERRRDPPSRHPVDPEPAFLEIEP
jgi:protein HIRA/HIR1